MSERPWGGTLRPDEFKLSISGGCIGHGLAESELLIISIRVQDLEKLVYRIVERTLDRPYRNSGWPLSEIGRGGEFFPVCTRRR